MPGEAEVQLRERLNRLRSLPLLRGAKLSRELERLQRQLERIAAEPSDEEIWRSVELARHPDRPYTERLAEAEVATGLGDAMVIGQATLDGSPLELAVMDFSFMGGSMGRVVGEKFATACESAAERGVPLVSVTASGGARMQEGILSLMQLPKTVCAVEDLHDGGGTLISVMAHPTTAGVLASFASLGDVLVAEPGALLSFTGPRVVQQTTREKLPDDFGLAESNYRHGHVDGIVPRTELRATVARLLRLFDNGA